MLNSIQSVWPHVVGQAWADAAFRERLLSDPQSVLAEFGDVARVKLPLFLISTR